MESETELEWLEFELHGSTSNLSPNGNSGTFKLGAFTVSYDGTTMYEAGTVASLVNGASVEVKGTQGTGGGGATIFATRIRFN